MKCQPETHVEQVWSDFLASAFDVKGWNSSHQIWFVIFCYAFWLHSSSMESFGVTTGMEYIGQMMPFSFSRPCCNVLQISSLFLINVLMMSILINMTWVVWLLIEVSVSTCRFPVYLWFEITVVLLYLRKMVKSTLSLLVYAKVKLKLPNKDSIQLQIPTGMVLTNVPQLHAPFIAIGSSCGPAHTQILACIQFAKGL